MLIFYPLVFRSDATQDVNSPRVVSYFSQANPQQGKKPVADPPLSTSTQDQEGFNTGLNKILLLKSVPFALPLNQSKSLLPESVQDWNGWKYLNGEQPVFPRFFPVDGDWSTVFQPTKSDQTPSAMPSSVWKMKVIIFRSMNGMITHPNGVVTPSRATLETPKLDVLLSSLVLASGVIESESHHQLRVDLSVDQEEEPFDYSESEADALAEKPLDINSYLEPRVNGGNFVSDDKKYRGPYNQVLVIWPMADGKMQSSVVNGMPVTCLSTVVGLVDKGTFATRILSAFDSAASEKLKLLGSRQTSVGSPTGSVINFFDFLQVPIASLTGFDAINGDDYNKNWRTPQLGRPIQVQNVSTTASVSSNVDVDLVQDPKKGKVLQVTMKNLHLRGGFLLPLTNKSDEFLKDLSSKWLEFDVKTASVDPLHIGVIADGKMEDVAGIGVCPGAGFSYVVSPDDKWHHVAIDFRPIFAKYSNITSIYIGADPDLTRKEKQSFINVTDQVADFVVSNGPPAPGVAVSSVESVPNSEFDEAAKVVALGPVADTPDAEKVFKAALLGPSKLVKLNALRTLSKYPAKDLVDSIITAANDFNPMVTKAAAQALAFQKTDTSVEFLKMQLYHSFSPSVRADSGLALASVGDPANLGAISSLIAARSWQARLIGVSAVALNGGPQKDDILDLYLSQTDPQIRLKAVMSIDITNEASVRKILFNSVNDPSDEVRATACEQVLLSPFPDLAKQGVRGFEDDSIWVRELMLNWGQAHTLDFLRNEAIKNLQNPYPQVRVAAINMLGSYKTPVSQEELKGVLNDTHPAVELALIGLVKSQKFSPTGDQLAIWKNSVDQTVADFSSNYQTP